MSKSDKELFELEDLVVQAGTYFNPQTEVAVVVDDSVALDPAVFADGEDAVEADGEGAEWIRISDEAPIDEQRRDELFEQFQTRRQPRETGEDFDEIDEIIADPLEEEA